MSDERVWLTHSEHGGHFHCPAGAVEVWTAADMGWVVADSPPEEHNPVIAENLAARAAAELAAQPSKSKTWTKATTEGN